MTWIDCTHTIRPGMIQWPTDTPFSQRRILSIDAGDGVNVTVTGGGVHIGTHIDAPLHFVDGGMDIASIPVDLLCGPVTVVEINERRDANGNPGLCREQDIPYRGAPLEEVVGGPEVEGFVRPRGFRA